MIKYKDELHKVQYVEVEASSEDDAKWRAWDEFDTEECEGYANVETLED